ncbi:hypothetical protein Tco_0413615 [Tanacetum coccineum]
MVSKSSSQQTKTQVTLASNVNFECDKGIIAFNNGIALLEHSNPLYLPMLKFLSNCCVSATLTKQPSAYYYEYLREFWYSTDVDAINTITFTLFSFDKPLSFNLDDFSSITGLKYSENYVSLPPKEMVRARLATLGLVDEKDSTLSSTDLGSHDQLNINQQVIAYSLCRGLNVDIGNILFSDLVAKLINGKKKRDANVCYTRYLSLIIEHLLRKDDKNDKLKTFKPHHILATSFKTPSANEVALIPHMLKVANISIKPEQTLILPSKEVNFGNTADKQSKSNKPVAESQHAKESVATADATKNIEASKSVEELRNQPEPADAENEHVIIIEEAVEDPLATDFGIRPLGNVSLDKLLQDQNMNVEVEESPFDTESQIKFIRKADQEMNVDADPTFIKSSFVDHEIKEADSDLESMSDDEIISVSGNKDDDSEELSVPDEIEADKEKKNIPMVKILNVQTLGAMRRFKEIQITKAPRSDPLGHLPRRLDFLSAQVNNVAKNLPIELNKKFASATSIDLKIVLDCAKHQMQLIKYIEKCFIPLSMCLGILWCSRSSEYSSIPPSKVADKGKGIAHTSDDDILKQVIPYMEEGGLAPNLPNLHQFRTAGEGPVTLKEAKLQMQEIRAQEEELAKIEAKRIRHMNKMRDEYNHCINFRDDPLPITKFSYRVNNVSKEATMRIIRNNQPLNLKIYDKFILKMLGFNEWIELHALASKTHSASNDQLIKNLKAKFQWVETIAGKLGIPPPP